MQDKESGFPLAQILSQVTDMGPKPLAVREPICLLALFAHNPRSSVEEIEK